LEISTINLTYILCIRKHTFFSSSDKEHFCFITLLLWFEKNRLSQLIDLS